MNVNEHTVVFDRGCNSKVNLKKVQRLKMYYVGALTPSHHEELIGDAEGKYTKVQMQDTELEVYRDKREIWGEERTVLVFISETLKNGQLRGVYQSLTKKKKHLRNIQRSLANPRTRKRSRETLERLLQKTLHGQFMEGLITYELTDLKKGRWALSYHTNQKQLSDLEDQLGFRIVMTNRHDWESAKIIKTFYGQATVEHAFKNLKNPYHLAITPGFHWTDHKIKIHYFTCVLGYFLSALIWQDAREAGFCGSLDGLLDFLNDIRLSRRVEMSGKKGKPKVIDELEKMSVEQTVLFKALDLSKAHLKPLKIVGVNSYEDVS